MIELREATRADIALLQHWDRQPHVQQALSDTPTAPAADHDDDSDWDDDFAIIDEHGLDVWQILIAEVLGGTDDRHPIGVIQIIDPVREPTGYWQPIRGELRAIDIWIGEAEYLGRGFGTDMMTQALARCFATEDVDAVVIDPLVSNTRAIAFYQRLGFEPIEKRYFADEDYCYVHRIERDAWAVLQQSAGRHVG